MSGMTTSTSWAITPKDCFLLSFHLNETPSNLIRVSKADDIVEISILNSLATLIDQKIPNTAGVATSRVTGSKELLLNQNIEYI